MAATALGRTFGAGIVAATLLAGFPAAADDMDTCYNGSGKSAIAACTRLIGSGKYKGKDLASVHGQRAFQHKVMDELDQALADYNRAIQIQPTALRYSNRANAKRLMDDTAGALADLDEALRLDPKRATVFAVRGLIWAHDKKDPDRAIADYSKAIEIEPNFTSSYTYRGQAYEQKGDRDRARADYKKALSLPAGDYSDGESSQRIARERLSELGG
jgi:tetratricopeptide (TPR) repeat protein